MIPAATETFSERTGPAVGSETRKSQRFAREFVQAFAFASQDDSHGALQVHVREVLFRAFIEANHPIARFLGLFHGTHQILHARHRQMRQSACGGPLGRVGQSGRAPFGNHDAACSGRERAAHDRSEIVRIFDAVEKNEKTSLGFSSEKIFQFDRRSGRRQSRHALMLAGSRQPVDLLAFFETHRHASRLRQAHQRLDAFAAPPARQDDTLERAPGGERLFDGMKSGDPVHGSGGTGRPLLDGRDRMAGDRFSAADFADALVGFSLQADAVNSHAERLRDCATHGGKVRTKLGAFADHHRIDVNDAETASFEQLAGVLEEKEAGRVLPLRICVREMRADVAEGGGTEKRVAECVAEDVSVGMADGAFVERDLDAANHQLAAFLEAMQIVADAGARHPIGLFAGPAGRARPIFRHTRDASAQTANTASTGIKITKKREANAPPGFSASLHNADARPINEAQNRIPRATVGKLPRGD